MTNNKNKEPIPLLAEIGAPGVKRHGGLIDEEWHLKIQGREAMRIYREMYDNSGYITGSMRAVQLLIRQAEWPISPT